MEGTSTLQFVEIKLEFGVWVDQILREQAKGDFRLVGMLKPKWIIAIGAADIIVGTESIIVRDHDVKHSFRDSKEAQLPMDWYSNLPHHLAHPDAVILDLFKNNEPALLLLYSPPAEPAFKLVVRLNYQAKLNGKKQAINIVSTGHIADLTGMKGKIGQKLILIEGRL